MHDPVHLLRRVGHLEAISFLVLLGVAMPLKYLAGTRLPVLVVGWVHGILFMLLCAVLWRAKRAAAWPNGRAALVLIAALLPFGPFVIDGRMRAWRAERGQSDVQG